MIECKNIIKEFGNPPQRVLHDLSFKINDGEFVSISGRSGSGKSTLLYIISTLDNPTSGQVLIDHQDVALQSVEDLHQFRNKKVGFIFQFHYLLPELTALENVLLPARNLNIIEQQTPHALELLKELEVFSEKDKYPSKMSGGQQQRVAIARALVLQPKYIFADEPTGNLDTYNAEIVMNMLKRTTKEHKTTIALVTHEPSYAALAERELYLTDGHLIKA